ncbi:MAG: cob(I)yrinic acid a,c-diamide adenosyltransferase [Tissierellia bacterium]|nr:cob(I)yrinic acid a,c-diamide adenosyltransferase [Tissierellia bacterium]
MAIYTKTGDKGSTSLYDGVRVGKDDVRVESYGTVDELGAYLGLATNFMDDEEMIREIRAIQNQLFVVNENLATQDPEKVLHHIKEEDIQILEMLVDKYMVKSAAFDGFVLNGTSKAAAALQVARTICRRAERRIVALDRVADVDPLVKQFVNRLADTIYAYARACEKEKIKVDFDQEFTAQFK